MIKKICKQCKKQFNSLTPQRIHCIDCINYKKRHTYTTNDKEIKIRENLKNLRIKYNLSQRKLAKKINTSSTIICNIELNKGKISIGIVLDLIDFYNDRYNEKLTLNDLYL